MTTGQLTADIWKSQIFVVNLADGQDPVKISARWNISAPSDTESRVYYHSVNLLLSPSLTKVTGEALGTSGTPLESIVRHVWRFHQSPIDGKESLVKVILPPRQGYVSRSDIIHLRMQHSKYVDGVISLSSWDRLLPVPAVNSESSLLTLLASSAGAVFAKQSQLSTSEVMQLLEDDMGMRLSFDWILPTRSRRYRVALIGGRPMPDPKSGQHGSSGFFMASQSLGISIVVYDESGHWLEGEEYAHMREDFVAIDMKNLEDLPHKLAQSVANRKNKIDGIVTFTDEYVVATAQAAELLGLPTEPAQYMMRAHHKSKMREVVHEDYIQAVTLERADQLVDPAFAETFQSLQYPLIVKPCQGRRSKGVKKVTDDVSLHAAVRMLSEGDLVEHGILIETYVDGPEFDANFVLWEGQILFLEVTDNFPCLADASDATLADNFAETVQISNTGLPLDEIDVIRSSVPRSLAKLGFSSGVFHCEGRMIRSTMHYRNADSHNGLDLIPHDAPEVVCSKSKPDVFLIEVNVRPPGTGGTWATLYTYGVDLGALQFLRAINDQKRFQALSAPFEYSQPSPGGGGGAQWWTAHCMIPIPTHRAQVRVPENFFDKLFVALPDVRSYVTRAEMYSEPGSIVSTTAGIGWIGYVLLGTRQSRAHALAMYRQIAETSKKILDDHTYDPGYKS
ncbi:hypothetical protein N7520_009336 [Penicillium odoratum]|uniref:uncharacterized protein n=1 Tax=Penicillium odoratum TaxID=1167516 RepID=UPI0025466096|nr:uncharacterized protein N7520_009336 [Penicillium odoratum]KAJ5752419.1 hypothetical protein N7520_009336 [Penicillium odoratum]